MNVYFAGGEDSDHLSIGGNGINTTAGCFRSAYARCALIGANVASQYWQNLTPYVGTPTSFWFSARIACLPPAAFNADVNSPILRFVDATGLERFRLMNTNNGSVPLSLVFQKVNTAGTRTTLTNTLSTWSWSPAGLGTPEKLDIHLVNAVSGSVNIYYNSILVYNFTGDTTTETTAIAYHWLACPGRTTQLCDCQWSEIIVTDTSSLNFSLQTLAPVSNGNTHNFDTGSPAASNVNEITTSDTTLDGSTTNGQIDQYTIPAIASGSFDILAVGIVARAVMGPSSAVSKMDLGFHIGSSDYWSSDITLSGVWASYQNWWTTSPATSGTWAGLPTNIGVKSVT